MMKPVLKTLALSILVGILSLTATIRTAFCRTLQERWDMEKSRPLSGMTDEVLDSVKNYHFFFISGIFNGFLASLYFKENMKVVTEELGATASSYGPWSRTPISENAELLHETIKKEYEKQSRIQGKKKPLILFAHSKGGAETFHTVLRYADLILDQIVDRVIIVQGAIRGSALASNKDIPYQMHLAHALYGKSLFSLTLEETERTLEYSFNTFEAFLDKNYRDQGTGVLNSARELFSQRIFFSPSFEEPKKLPFIMKTAHWFCGKSLDQHGRNDGILLTSDQYSERIGINLGEIEAGHGDLTGPGFGFNTTSEEIRAYTRAVIQQAFEVNRTEIPFDISAIRD